MLKVLRPTFSVISLYNCKYSKSGNNNSSVHPAFYHLSSFIRKFRSTRCNFYVRKSSTMERGRNSKSKTISGDDLAEKLSALAANSDQNNETLRKNDSFFNGMTHHDSSPYFTDYDQNVRSNDLKNSTSGKNGNSSDNNNNNNNGDELHQLKKFEIKSTEIKFEDESGRPKFRPRKVLILTKLTRLEFERRTNPDVQDEDLAKLLKERGSDYNRLLAKYRVHSNYLKTICDELQKQGIEYRTVQRWDYSEENIEWADAIFTAGGDGTFLLAASKIRSRNKPVIGINTDPSGSEGYMCLLKKLPENKFPEALSRLLRGEFQWLWRQRIRVTLSGKHAFDDPIELHDQQLIYPEYRWSEHVREYEDVRNRLKTHFKGCTPLYGRAFKRKARSASPSQSAERVLPFLALNEVFIGESLSSRVSYYELQIDNKEKVKQKSSGFTVCTGTGSTSWYFNINKLTDRCVADLLQIINEELGVELPTKDPAVINKLCRRFNDQLIFSPSDLHMAFTVRDPVFNATYTAAKPRGFAKKVVVKSRCFDAHLVIDGGLSYIFNDGAQATLEMFEEDALRTVIFR